MLQPNGLTIQHSQCCDKQKNCKRLYFALYEKTDYLLIPVTAKQILLLRFDYQCKDGSQH